MKLKIEKAKLESVEQQKKLSGYKEIIEANDTLKKVKADQENRIKELNTGIETSKK